MPAPNNAAVTEADLSQLVVQSPLAIFLVGEQSKILYRNKRAEQLLAQGGIVGCVSGKLLFNAPGAPRLCDILAAFGNQTAIEPAQTRVALKGPDGSVWLAQIGVKTCGGPHDTRAVAIVLSEAIIDLDGAAALVSDVFALTQAERRALPALLRFGRVRQVAHRFGVSAATIKSHLKNIYAKTATKQRNDLFKLVARFAMVRGL